jgi:hypothetical protein
MKRIEDYNVPLVLLKTFHHMRHDPTPDKQIIRREELLAKEGSKQYETSCGKRIKKTDLMVIKAEDFQLYSHFSVVCQPEQVEEMAAKLTEKVRENLSKNMCYLQSLMNATDGGHSVVDKEQYTKFINWLSSERNRTIST